MRAKDVGSAAPGALERTQSGKVGVLRGHPHHGPGGKLGKTGPGWEGRPGKGGALLEKDNEEGVTGIRQRRRKVRKISTAR